MENKYNRMDFKVGQKVYIEITWGSNKGNILEEIVEKIGTKYVTTNRERYSLADGRNVSEYQRDYEIWLSEDGLLEKIEREKLAKNIEKHFFSPYGVRSFSDKLTLEELREIRAIIENAYNR